MKLKFVIDKKQDKDKKDKERVSTWSDPTGRKPCTLCCNSTGKRVFLFPWKKAQEVDLPLGAVKEKETFENWSGFDADSAFTIQFAHNELKAVGEPLSIIYVSDKWTGEAERYRHEFKSGNRLCNNNMKSPRIWGFLNKRGKRLVSSRGIVG